MGAKRGEARSDVSRTGTRTLVLNGEKAPSRLPIPFNVIGLSSSALASNP